VDQCKPLADGRTRERGTALSEKLLAGEDWRSAAPRAVAEELGSILPEDYSLDVAEGRGLHSSTFRLNVCTFCGIH
jgi:hypothetical protein